MRKVVRGVVAALVPVGALAVPTGALHASSDYTCSPSWTLSAAYMRCGSRAVLSPGNDTRVNLMLLALDRAGMSAPPGAKIAAADFDTQGFRNTFVSWDSMTAALWPKASPVDTPADDTPFVAPEELAFSAALAANRGLSAGERTALVAGRQLLRQSAPGDQPETPFPAVSSALGREFLGYLQAADAFYREDMPTARTRFTALATAGDPWVAETATYMLARVELIAALAPALDESGWMADMTKADTALAKAGEAALDTYLKRYPQGRYNASATGLKRRAWWLQGDMARLGAEYDRMLAALPSDGDAAAQVIQEADAKGLFRSGAPNAPGAMQGAILLAASDLLAMRSEGPAEPEYDDDGKVIAKAPEPDPLPTDAPSLSELSGQKARFGARGDLLAFLQANHAFYVARDPARVLALIADDSGRNSYSPVAFSAQVLRGQALAATRSPDEAAFWTRLLAGSTGLWQRPTVELGLALNYERSGRLADVFAARSPILDSGVRRQLLMHSASPAILRAEAAASTRPQDERDLAGFVLLAKEIMRGNWADFAADTAVVRPGADKDAGLWNFPDGEAVPVGIFTRGKVSDGYACPAIAATARTLAARPGDAKARLCWGDFLRLNDFDGFTLLDTPPAADELGGAVHQFGGKPIERGTIYPAIFGDPKVAYDDRAYALLRQLRCYAPAGNNSCGGEDVELPQRRAWFQQLKRDYPKSRWAQTKIYW